MEMTFAPGTVGAFRLEHGEEGAAMTEVGVQESKQAKVAVRRMAVLDHPRLSMMIE